MNLICHANWILRSILLLTLGQASAFAAPPTSAELRTERTVLLMRHGVRSGIVSDQIARISNRSWPDFGIADGQLTAHGRTALILWGQYHRRQLAEQGQLPADGALTAKQVRAFASPFQRTRESAEAFLEGMSPGNSMPVSHADTQSLFIPFRAGLRDADPDKVRGAVIEALGMPLETAQKHYQPVIQEIENAMGVTGERLSAQPWRLYADARNLHITPLKEVSNLVETVRMQYANNFPLQDVGFGLGTDQAALNRLMATRTVSFDATHRPRFIAVRQGANLFNAVARSLAANGVDQESADGAVSLFVGHDGTLATFQGILGFHWQVPDHPRNDVNPGAMMKFERVRDLGDGERYIRISYLSPTLDQLRHLSPFNDDSPPSITVFEPPLALAPTGGSLIPLQRFASLAADVEREAAPESPLGTVVPEGLSVSY